MVLQAIYSPRDVADLIKRLHTQWVCRWFIGYHRHSAIWSSEEFHTLSQELLESELYGDLFESLRELSEDAEMFADPSFRVDTFLLARWASYC
ncbi:hypothetical protein NOR53_2778 [gamma proteobacterium NOR5-3]|nr:hypothetical protein NOR53_2778 [gamma proteobacterium NOR5-3]